MLCDICGKNPATIHIQEIIGSEKKIIHLCQECAEKKSREDSSLNEFNLAEVLFQISNQISGQSKEGTVPVPEQDPDKITCPTCGWNSGKFQKTGKMGCPDCYQTFHEILDRALDTMHRGSVHTGKTPVPFGGTAEGRPKPSVPLLRMNIQHLQNELEEAVAAERYEEAAVIRDKIAEFKKGLEDLQYG
jgi:protein arginine kinase activator